jgi:hypothetical protein
VKIDRLDTDLMARMRDSPIWRDYEGRIRTRYEDAVRSCLNPGNDEKALRLAQGAVEALKFVLGLPDTIEKEVRRKTDAG